MLVSNAVPSDWGKFNKRFLDTAFPPFHVTLAALTAHFRQTGAANKRSGAELAISRARQRKGPDAPVPSTHLMNRKSILLDALAKLGGRTVT